MVCTLIVAQTFCVSCLLKYLQAFRTFAGKIRDVSSHGFDVMQKETHDKNTAFIGRSKCNNDYYVTFKRHKRGQRHHKSNNGTCRYVWAKTHSAKLQVTTGSQDNLCSIVVCSSIGLQSDLGTTPNNLKHWRAKLCRDGMWFELDAFMLDKDVFMRQKRGYEWFK